MQNIEDALDRNFTSPNVADSNLEAANLVDTTDKIAQGLFAIAEAIDRLTDAISSRDGNQRVGDPTGR